MAPPAEKPDNKLDVTVVVSGDPVSVTVNPHQKADALIREALRKAEAANSEPGGYLLTFNDREVAGDTPIGAIGLRDGDTLFLAPRQGVGG